MVAIPHERYHVVHETCVLCNRTHYNTNSQRVVHVIPPMYEEKPEIGILQVPRIQDRIEFHLNWGAPLGCRRPLGLEDLEPETTTSGGIQTLDVCSRGTSSCVVVMTTQPLFVQQTGLICR